MHLFKQSLEMSNYQRRPFTAFLSIIFFLTTAVHAQIVTVGGEVATPLKLDSSNLERMKHVEVKAISHQDHHEHSFSGVPLSVIISQSGAIPDNQLRGKYLSKYILVTGADGYKAVIAIPETDPAFTDNTIILADREDGKILDKNTGSFQIIVPGDKRPARCVRQVVAIDILSSK
jgi:hypothetical protein